MSIEWFKKNVLNRDETRRLKEKREEEANRRQKEEYEDLIHAQNMSGMYSIDYGKQEREEKAREEQAKIVAEKERIEQIVEQRLNEERKKNIQTQYILENKIEQCEQEKNELQAKLDNINQSGGKSKSKKRVKKNKLKKHFKKTKSKKRVKK